MTYHGPGQLVCYVLIDLKRLRITIRHLVSALEKATIAVLALYDIEAYADEKARGVYVNGEKICSIGLRVKQYRSYHGLAFNIKTDLSAFKRIHPCGFQQLKVTQLSNCGGPDSVAIVKPQLAQQLQKQLHYSHLIMKMKATDQSC